MKYFFREWVMPVIIALVIVLLLNTYVFRLVTVPTGSMIETIVPGDKLYVNKIFNVDNVKRGDILVFKSEELDKLLVKRLIGLPGDTVEIKQNGDLYINGEKLDEPYKIESQCKEQTFNIPEDSLFFLGDNRPDSYDARDWQNPYINKSAVLGNVVFRFFPLNRIGLVK